MNVSELSDPELVSAIERRTSFQFRGMAWCVQANCSLSHKPTAFPDTPAVGVTYWGDATAASSQNPDLIALTAVEAVTQARVHMAQDGVVQVSGMAVFTGRDALQRILSALLEPGAAAELHRRNSKRAQGEA